MTAPDWRARALCRGLAPTDGTTQPHPFFPDDGKVAPDIEALCLRCPVQHPCSLDRGSDEGQRGDGLRGRHATRRLVCVECGDVFFASGGAYKRCAGCSPSRRRGAA